MGQGRTLGQVASLLVDDVVHHRGSRLRNGVRWRFGRLRNRWRRYRRRHLPKAPPIRIYSVAFGPVGDQVLRTMQQQSFTAGLTMMFGGGDRETARTVHIATEDVRRFCELLAEGSPGVEVFARVKGRRGWRRPLDPDVITRLETRGRSFDLLLVERRVVPSPGAPEHIQCSRLDVAVWRDHEGPYGRLYKESDKSFELVGRLRHDTFERMTADRHDFDDDFPAPSSPNFAIDVVYTWVDGDDPDWQQLKARFSGQVKVARRVVHDERFRSRDELRYSLRSLHQFAPWIRRIHIVTAGQQPEWLNLSHPKINLVSHEDIYRNTEWLPTFNSSGIETQLHHVAGLADRFIYFNDDFFLGQLCDPIDFFAPNGVLKFFPSDQRAYEPDIDGASEEYIQADKNAIKLMKTTFRSSGRAIMSHVPYPADRSLLAEMEERFQKQFDSCAASRFRSSKDLRPIAFFQYHYGFQTGRAQPARISHRYLALWKPMIDEQLAKVESSRAFKTFCVNDVGLQEERLDEVNELVGNFLESYFPVPSPYELPDN